MSMGQRRGIPRDDNEHTRLKAGKALRRGVSWAPERVHHSPSLPTFLFIISKRPDTHSLRTRIKYVMKVAPDRDGYVRE